MGLEQQIWRLYKVRQLVSEPFIQMTFQPVATRPFNSQAQTMFFHPVGESTHLSWSNPFSHAEPTSQGHFPKFMMKLKSSRQHVISLCGKLNGLNEQCTFAVYSTYLSASLLLHFPALVAGT